MNPEAVSSISPEKSKSNKSPKSKQPKAAVVSSEKVTKPMKVTDVQSSSSGSSDVIPSSSASNTVAWKNGSMSLAERLKQQEYEKAQQLKLKEENEMKKLLQEVSFNIVDFLVSKYNMIFI